MAKINIIDLPSPPPEIKKFDEVVNYLSRLSLSGSDSLSTLSNEFNGRIEVVNLYAVEVTIADTGAANTDFTVTHNLGQIPKFYIPRITSALAGAASFYDGSVAWNSLTITLKCTAANLVVKFLVLA